MRTGRRCRRDRSPAPIAFLAGSFLILLSACERKALPEQPAGIAPAPAFSTPSRAAERAPPLRSPPLEPDPTLREIVEALPDVLSSGETVAGKIRLVPAVRAKVVKGDTIFLIARRAGSAAGPGSMIAVQKLQAADFPMPFALSSRDAMIPGTVFEGHIDITARVDKDSDAMTRRKGDVYGRAAHVKVGMQGVVITLDTVQTEDVTLGDSGMLSGPRGLPPGHP